MRAYSPPTPYTHLQVPCVDSNQAAVSSIVEKGVGVLISPLHLHVKKVGQALQVRACRVAAGVGGVGIVTRSLAGCPSSPPPPFFFFFPCCCLGAGHSTRMLQVSQARVEVLERGLLDAKRTIKALRAAARVTRRRLAQGHSRKSRSSRKLHAAALAKAGVSTRDLQLLTQSKLATEPQQTAPFDSQRPGTDDASNAPIATTVISEDVAADAVEANMQEEQKELLVLASQWRNLGRRLEKLVGADSLTALQQAPESKEATEPPKTAAVSKQTAAAPAAAETEAHAKEQPRTVETAERGMQTDPMPLSPRAMANGSWPPGDVFVGAADNTSPNSVSGWPSGPLAASPRSTQHNPPRTTQGDGTFEFVVGCCCDSGYTSIHACAGCVTSLFGRFCGGVVFLSHWAD